MFGTVEDGSGKLASQPAARSTQDGLENLAKVHTGRHTHRVQYQVDRASVFQERHVLHAHNLGNDTLVAMATGQLVADLNLTLLGNVDLGHLNDTGR